MTGSWIRRISAATLAASTAAALAFAAPARAGDPADGPPRTLVRNAALVLTLDPALGEGDLGILRDADVLVERGRIAAVGRGLRGGGARVVDATGKIVLPGLVDAHDHLWQSTIRGCAAGEDVNAWLAACVYPQFGFGWTRAEAYAAVRLAAADLVRGGVTTTVEWAAGFGPEFVRGSIAALDDSGLRFAYAYFGSADPDVIADIREVKRTLIDPNPRASLQLAGQPSPWFGADLAASADLAARLGVKLHVHLLENVAQRWEGQMEVLAAAGALGPNLLAAHAIHLEDGEIDTLAAAGASVLHCPQSNMRLASGVIRMARLREAKVTVGLGLDGGTNDGADLFAGMRAAVGLQRATALDPRAYPGVADAIRMATVEGARALGLEHEIGSLTPGKRADLVVLDPRRGSFAPVFRPVAQIVFNAQPAAVEWVMVDGRFLLERGRLVGVDEEAVLDAAQAVSDRLQGFLPP
jgi:5-methylthioadenosine/S-adenosylhomocysteine deaminase